MWKLFIFLLILCISIFGQSNEDCMMCHSDPELTGLNSEGQEISMYVDSEKYEKSTHAEFSCVDCHQDLYDLEEYPHKEELETVSCGMCHSGAAEEYSETMHGLKFINMEEQAPECWDCHGKHDVLAPDNPESKVYFQNLPTTCSECHESEKGSPKGGVKRPFVKKEYLRGVHGKMVAQGMDAAPTCNTCHPAHSIRKRVDPQSTIYKLNVSSTCGECHVDALAEYSESIHARALRHGLLESATCTDCHGEHEIFHPDSAYLVASHDACIECHNNPNVQRKYDLPQTVVSTYEDSYHGLSARIGKEDAATCGSCHGNHNILGPDEPFSRVHQSNLVETCSQCHKNVTKSFANSYTHEAMLIRGNPVNYWVTVIYVLIIGGVIGGMIVHNLIIFLKYIRYKKIEEKQYYIVRFKKTDVFQHAVLMVSFTVLAISGFALKFPEAWWVDMLGSLGITEWGRRLIHRVSAVVLVAISLYHLYYISFTTRGRYLFKQIMLRARDIPEVVQTVKYYLGLSKSRPQYDEFDYTEKAEYWSVVWGTVVMGVTGLVLWFPALVTGFAPSWVVRAAELIHYYEAILATLAIVIFHLFFVIAHPEQYPMNLSWLSGKMSLRSAIRKHPKWVERVLKERQDPDLLPEVIQRNCESIADVDNYLKFGDLYEEMKKGKKLY